MNETVQKGLKMLAVAAIFFVALWGLQWCFKIFTYWLFYEDMVIETVKELVKLESLR